MQKRIDALRFMFDDLKSFDVCEDAILRPGTRAVHNLPGTGTPDCPARWAGLLGGVVRNPSRERGMSYVLSVGGSCV